MERNALRQVEWLWRQHRPLHGDTGDISNEIQIIRAEVEGQRDTVIVGGSGAYIHLTVSDQTIAVGGEDVNWAGFNALGVFDFQPTFPTTTIQVLRSGYYNLAVPVLEWETRKFSGSVSIWRNDIKVWPPPNDTAWSTTVRSVWRADTAHAVWFDAGDTFRLFIDHGDASSKVLAHAALSAYLVDRTAVQVSGGFVVGSDADVTGDSARPVSVTVTVPTDVQDGDLLVAFVYSIEPTINSPAGWTTHTTKVGRDEYRYRIDWRKATASDAGSDYTWQGTDGTLNEEIGVVVVALRGMVDTASPIGTVGFADATTAVTSVSPSTTLIDEIMTLVFAGTTDAPANPSETHAVPDAETIQEYVETTADKRIVLSAFRTSNPQSSATVSFSTDVEDAAALLVPIRGL